MMKVKKYVQLTLASNQQVRHQLTTSFDQSALAFNVHMWHGNTLLQLLIRTRYLQEICKKI